MDDIVSFGLYSQVSMKGIREKHCQMSMKDIRENISIYTFEKNPQIYII